MIDVAPLAKDDAVVIAVPDVLTGSGPGVVPAEGPVVAALSVMVVPLMPAIVSLPGMPVPEMTWFTCMPAALVTVSVVAPLAKVEAVAVMAVRTVTGSEDSLAVVAALSVTVVPLTLLILS